MKLIVLLLLPIIASVKASSVCPFPDQVLCGSDGNTYRNLCEWEAAALYNPDLDLRHRLYCKQPSNEELYQALQNRNGNRDLLRSRRKKRPKIEPRMKNIKREDIRVHEKLLSRLAQLPFNFRREQQDIRFDEED